MGSVARLAQNGGQGDPGPQGRGVAGGRSRRDTLVMGFRIIYNVAGSFEDFDDLAQIAWDQGGHLVVTTHDKRRTFSDHGWVCIEEPPTGPNVGDEVEADERTPSQSSRAGEASASW